MKRTNIEATKNSAGRVEHGKITAGGKSIKFINHWDDDGYLLGISFEGKQTRMPSLIDLYYMLGEKFIERIRRIDLIDLISEITLIREITKIDEIVKIDSLTLSNPDTQVEYISNGGFETGSLAGWTITGSGDAYNTWAHSGVYSASLDYMTELEQTLATPLPVGKVSAFNLWVLIDNAGTGLFSVVVTYSDASTSTHSGYAVPRGVWHNFDFMSALTAGKTITKIKLRAIADEYPTWFDDVTLIGGAKVVVNRVDEIVTMPALTISTLPAVDVSDRAARLLGIAARSWTLTTTDEITASPKAGTTWNKHDASTYKVIAGSVNASGDNDILTPTAGKIIKIHSYDLQAQGTVTAQLYQDTGGSRAAVGMPWKLQDREGKAGSFKPYPAFQLKTATADKHLNLYLSAAITVGYEITYTDADVS